MKEIFSENYSKNMCDTYDGLFVDTAGQTGLKEAKSAADEVCVGDGNELRAFLLDDSAVGVVEIILILVVLISLVILFKGQLTSLVTSILEKITNQSSSI